MSDDDRMSRRADLKQREAELDAGREPGTFPAGPATEEEIEREAVEACREPTFSVDQRQETKRLSRERDIAQARAGLPVENGFFSVLDASEAKIVERRKRVRLEPDEP